MCSQAARYHALESVEVGEGTRAPALELQKPLGAAAGASRGQDPGPGPDAGGNASGKAGGAAALLAGSKVTQKLMSDAAWYECTVGKYPWCRLVVVQMSENTGCDAPAARRCMQSQASKPSHEILCSL